MSRLEVTRYYIDNEGSPHSEVYEFRVAVAGGLRCGALAPLHPNDLDEVVAHLPDGTVGNLGDWADGWYLGAVDAEFAPGCANDDNKLIVECYGQVGAIFSVSGHLGLFPSLIPDRFQALAEDPPMGLVQVGRKDFDKAVAMQTEHFATSARLADIDAVDAARLEWDIKHTELSKASIGNVELFIGGKP